MAALAASVTAAAGGRRQNDSCSSTAYTGQQFQNWKKKDEQAKKVEFIRTAQKLKTQFTNVEKDRNRHLYNRRGDFRVEYSILAELERSMSISRKTERAKILQQLSKIQNNVEKVQQQLQDVKPTAEFINKLKEMMEEVENAINAFKEEQRQIYEQLLKEEKAAINELAVLERKVELWTLISNLTTEKLLKLAKSRVSVDKTLENHLPKEVTEFERFPERTGRWQGGWDDYDHHHFLKIQTRRKGKLSYVDEAHEYLCGRTEDTEQHDKCHQEFLILHKKNKESIKKWKKHKQQEKDGNLKEKSEKILKEEWLQCEEAQKKNAEEGKRHVANEARKKQKAVAFAMEQPARQKQEETEKKQEKERQQRHHVKLLLEGDTLQKKEKEEPEKLERKREEAEKEERKRTAAEKNKFQEHDLHKLELRILQIQAKEVGKQEKQKRLAKLQEKVEIHTARDQPRLDRPTMATALMALECRARVPHGAVPTWRQGL